MPTLEVDRWEKKARSWLWVRDEWPELASNSRALAVASKKPLSLEPLLGLKRLEALHVTPVRPGDLDVLAKLRALKVLLLYDIRVPSLEPLTGLEALRVFRLMHAAKVVTLGGLERFKQLRSLDIYHLPNVNSLEPLSGLSELRELRIMQSMGTNKPLRFDSLAPLARLKNLELLQLHGVYPRDGSLRPLAHLKNLRFLALNIDLPIAEYACLAAFLPSSVSPVLHPVMPGDSFPHLLCRRCNRPKVRLVGKTSKRSPILVCPECQKKLVDEHVRIFQELVKGCS